MAQHDDDAMPKEFDSLVEKDTFELRNTLKGKNSIGSQQVYPLKYKDDRRYKYKTWFVAKGYLQMYGKGYRDTLAPMTNLSSIRILLQIAVQYNLQIHYMNVKSKYLNAPHPPPTSKSV